MINATDRKGILAVVKHADIVVRLNFQNVAPAAQCCTMIGLNKGFEVSRQFDKDATIPIVSIT